MLLSGISFGAWCAFFGILNILFGIAYCFFSKVSSVALLGFPRSKVAGAVLCSIALGWSAVLVYICPLDFVVAYSKIISAVLVALIPITCIFLDELLACRALGGLLVLIPAPVLMVCRTVDSSFRLVLVSLVYIYAIMGMFYIAYPYMCRNLSFAIAKKPKVAGIIHFALGALLLWGVL